MDFDKNIFLLLADKNLYDSLHYRNNMNVSDNNQLDIDSWFGSQIEYLMIFMCISSIINIIGFTILVVLCYKKGKVQYALSYVLGTTPFTGYDIDPDLCPYDFLYMYFYFDCS